MPIIEILTIGDELLLGLRTNRHLLWLGKQLAQYGLMIQRNFVIGDAPEVITETVAASWNRSDIVIITGGLGPTKDDLTREASAQALGLPLEFVPELRETITHQLAQRGAPFTDNNLQQCYKLKGAEILANPNGTALGLFLIQASKLLIMLPGPPAELQPMWSDEVIPRLRKINVLGNRTPSYLQFCTSGLGEALLATKLQPVFSQYEDLSITYCAHFHQIEIRLTSAKCSPEALRLIAEECRQRLGADFLGYGDCVLAEVVLCQLRDQKKTLALAESCTGGYLANDLTHISGASSVLAGGVVCYSDASKTDMLGVPVSMLTTHGAVSAETTVALAEGAARRFHADYALSTTGFAGPSGGDERHPIGTAYIGYHSPDGTTCSKHLFHGDRHIIKTKATHAALDGLRRQLLRASNPHA